MSRARDASASRIFKLSPADFGRMQTAVRERLRERGSSASDEVLPEYVMVMVQNQKTQAQVASELKAFLGSEASPFTEWLWSRLIATADGTPSAKATADKTAAADGAGRRRGGGEGGGAAKQASAARGEGAGGSRRAMESEREQRAREWEEWAEEKRRKERLQRGSAAAAAAAAAAEAESVSNERRKGALARASDPSGNGRAAASGSAGQGGAGGSVFSRLGSSERAASEPLQLAAATDTTGDALEDEDVAFTLTLTGRPAQRRRPPTDPLAAAQEGAAAAPPAA